jgi:dynein heavy chain 1
MILLFNSLTSQCLQKVLKVERPDIDEKRGRQLALQGQFRVRLRNLEDSLLTALSEVKGNILDDDSVMSALETLKSDAEDIGKKMSESDRVMEEILEVSNVYRPFAVACSR